MKLLPEEVCENICGKMMGGMIGRWTMIHMEISSAGKAAAEKRMRKYQKALKGKEAGWHEQDDCSKVVCRGCSAAD